MLAFFPFSKVRDQPRSPCSVGLSNPTHLPALERWIASSLASATTTPFPTSAFLVRMYFPSAGRRSTGITPATYKTAGSDTVSRSLESSTSIYRLYYLTEVCHPESHCHTER